MHLNLYAKCRFSRFNFKLFKKDIRGSVIQFNQVTLYLISFLQFFCKRASNLKTELHSKCVRNPVIMCSHTVARGLGACSPGIFLTKWCDLVQNGHAKYVITNLKFNNFKDATSLIPYFSLRST